MRALGLDPIADTRRTFNALRTAMARPGTIQQVPTPADHAVLAALVDHEVSLATPDQTLANALEREGRLVSAAPADADVVHAAGTPEWDPTDLTRGRLVEPSEGATVVYRVGTLGGDGEVGADNKPATDTDSDDNDSDAPATTIRVRGPGIPGERTAVIGLPATHMRKLAKAGAEYPRGVDAVFTRENQVLALPRSVTLEVR
jgi:alpha-D-ribose 1-methylphosphonate 5-triphosphate synthase subunit PhnH